ncbi:MAG: TonB-dependent receptor [Gammaproteobacteria bacterium AqS3]|nr:TonB-dependent receptor [Gammaproteobacteria bacterium AqS3]
MITTKPTDRFRVFWLLRMAALGLAALSIGLPAAAQDDSAMDDDDLDEVVVTGTYIKGTPIDTASPVSTITDEELQRQGSPTLVEMIQKLEFSSGRTYGQTNQFQNNAGEGIATVNLRGLGAQRTLVLINGQRQVVSPFRRGFVDINQIPSQAIQRVEILKEGASATYGSDAVAGVINFITDNRYEGFEVRGSYQNIADSDGGDVQYGLKYGSPIGDNAHGVITFNYHKRGDLAVQDRDWAMEDLAFGRGASSIGNPGALMATASGGERAAGLGSTTRDPNCTLSFANATAVTANRCLMPFIAFDNLIDEEEHTNIFAEYTQELGNGGTLNASFLLSMDEVPHWDTSPSYPPQELFGIVQFLPPNHPGMVAMVGTWDSTIDTDNDGTADGAYTGGTHSDYFNANDRTTIARKYTEHGAVFWGRVAGAGGQPGGQSRVAIREYETTRFALSYNNTLSNGMDVTASLMIANQEGQLEGVDELIANTALAFRGYGGPDCGAKAHLSSTGELIITLKDNTVVEDYSSTDRPDGCEWYNPLSNAIPFSRSTGAVNQDYDARYANSPALMNWLERYATSVNTTELTVAEVIFSKETDWSLDGGNIAWAAGAQVRSFSEELKNDVWNDAAQTPCPFSWNGVEFVDVTGNTQVADKRLNGTDSSDSATYQDPKPIKDTASNCQSATGPSSFLAASTNYNESQDINALFGEVALPYSDEFDIQVAVRYEDYGSAGDSIDPKIALRYSPREWFTLRASASSTFRGPLAYESSTAKFTALQLILQTGAFKAVDTKGNPDIQPEKAQTFNVGLVFQGDMFETSLDIWQASLSDPIIIESHNWIVGAYESLQVAAATAATAAGNAAVAALTAPSPEEQKTAREAAVKKYWQDNFNTVVADQIICTGTGGNEPMKASALRDSPVVTEVPCAVGGTTRVEVNYVNGPDTDIAGTDLFFRFFTDGGFEYGLSASYLSQYEASAYLSETGETLNPASEYVGTMNFSTSNPLPRWKGRTWVQQRFFNDDSGAVRDLRVQANHIPGYLDQRAANGRNDVKPMTTLDVTFNTTLGLNQKGQLAVSIYNFMDIDPPKTFTDLGYDAFVHNPFGRMIKVGGRYNIQ